MSSKIIIGLKLRKSVSNEELDENIQFWKPFEKNEAERKSRIYLVETKLDDKIAYCVAPV